MKAVPLLRLESVSRIFGNRDATTAVRDVSLDVVTGEFVAIIGRSGSGKSTLLNVLGLLDRPSTGRYSIEGQDVARLSERKRDDLRGRNFGFVFQDSNGLEHRSVAKNIELTLAIQRYPSSSRGALIEQALRTVGLLHRANHRAGDLSGGERQRMAIARAIVHKPAVLLVDEPTGSLDTANADEVHRLLNELNAAGTTIVAVTHDERLAAAAKRRVVIQDGLVLSDEISRTRSSESRVHSGRHERGSSLPVWVDRLSDAVSAVAERGAKSLLNILVIALGIAGVVAGVGINLSATAQVAQIFDDAALDEVRIATRSGAEPLTLADTESAASLGGVGYAGLFYSLAADAVRVSRLRGDTPGSAEFGGTLLGITPGTLGVFGVRDVHRYYAAMSDPILAQHSVLIGESAANELGIAAAGPGVRIWINGSAFNVTGIIKPDAKHASVANMVMVSAQAMSTSIAPEEVPLLIVKTDPGRARAVADALPLALSATTPGNYVAQSTADLAELRATVDGSLAGVFSAVAAVLLLVAILSTSSSLSASVLYRQKEIGLRRALGASRLAITALFTREGLLLGALGGVSGTAIGVCGLVVLSLAQNWPAHIDGYVISAAILLGLLTGMLSSLVPAARASKLDPAVALRA